MNWYLSVPLPVWIAAALGATGLLIYGLARWPR
jgi:hypothetical protein